MSVSSTISSLSYSGNASTSAAYPVTFQFFDATDLTVYVVDSAGVSTTLVLGTGYTVSGGAGSTGNVLTTAAVPSTSQVVITRNTAKTQLTSYTTGDRFPASTHEKALDKLTFIAQENARKLMPDTAATSGSAPYVLGLSAAGGTPTWTSQSSASIADGSITPAKLSAGKPTWDTSGNLTATSFIGPVTGNVTGNLTGNVTGNVTGNLTGTASAIPDLIVSTAKVQDSAITTAKIADSTITSAKIADGAIVTADLANNAVTAAKLGTNEQKQIAKAWVNFNGLIITSSNGASGTSLVVTAGSNQGTWNIPSTFTSAYVGAIYYFNIGGTNATLGGVNVSTIGVQITSFVSANQVTFTLLAGNATLSQTVNGTGAAGGYAFTTSGIRSSYNVSSITKNGTGNYTVNFATAMADANYSFVGNAQGISGTTTLFIHQFTGYPITQNLVQFITGNQAGTAYDSAYVWVQIFGN
jgi:hypothetical protein